MVEARQLSATDASILNQQIRSGIQKPVATEEDVLHWLAKEYDLGYTSLDDVEPDRELLSLLRERQHVRPTLPLFSMLVDVGQSEPLFSSTR